MTWKQEKLKAQLIEVEAIKDHVIVSGGLAWHLMSPPHEEVKIMHDHKDVDLFVIPDKFNIVVSTLKERGFTRYWTKYDNKTPNFYRYGLTSEIPRDNKKIRVKVLMDLFLEEVPFIEINGLKIVEPKHLLSLYSGVHTSSDCTAVREASKLVARGISPVGRLEIIKQC